MESVINKKPKNSKMQNCSDNKPLCMMSIPHVGGISEKFKRIIEIFNIKTVLKQNML